MNSKMLPAKSTAYRIRAPMRELVVATSLAQDRDMPENIGGDLDNVVAKQTERVEYATSHELKEALRQLYSPEAMTMEFALKIESHAENLSMSLCKAFIHLKEIMERHEPLIRRRWAAKKRAERQTLLLEVFPTMATSHRTDSNLATEEVNGIYKGSCSMADPIVFPYINLEDLSKPQPLLVFLSARAFNLPWTFANTEDEFSPYFSRPTCRGHGSENVRLDSQFTKDPEPGKYGEAVIVVGPVGAFDPTNKEVFYRCSGHGLHMLYVQERIYTFLLGCVRAILHDMDEDSLKNAPISTPRDTYVASGETAAIQETSHTLFSDMVLFAPYRARSSVDFNRLRAYFDGAFSNAKEHVRALREDPSYMNDTIKDISSHQPELVKDTKGRVHWRVGRPEFTSHVLKEIVVDAYMDLGLWKSLFEKTDKLCRLTTSGQIGDLHDFRNIVGTLRDLAYQMLYKLMNTIVASASGSPGLRHLYIRHEGCHGLKDTCGHKLMMKKNTTSGLLVSEICITLDQLDNLASQEDIDEKLLFHVLDRLDMVLKDNSKRRTMISSVVACKVAELSIVTECIRQIAMWMATPEIIMSERTSNRTWHVTGDEIHDFRTWVFNIVGCSLLVSVVDPSRGCLTYPIHHYPNRKNVEQMRKAEQNLDKFWSHVDSWYEKQSGHAQHEYIKPYVVGEVRRTPPWIEKLSSPRLDDVFVPIPDYLHDRSKQVTGAFDRSPEAKKKLKTHGLPEQAQVTEAILDAPDPSDAAPDQPEIRRVDKRTFKTLKTIFGTNTYSEGEVSKIIKWDAFVRAMIRTGFAAEKLQGSAWQFTPHGNTAVERSIQFHEPHPDSDIPYIMARRFGRRLERVYGWTSDTFQLDQGVEIPA
ncbi:hypothetical protein PMIN03_001803 [Paraphaeosphaeria minitans]